MGAAPVVNKKQIPNTDVSYVDANGDGWFRACDKEGCDYYESSGNSLRPNDPKVKEALGEYKLPNIVGNMLTLGFMFGHMNKLRNGDSDEQYDAAVALSTYPESVLAIPLLTSVANDVEIEQRVRDAARESISAITNRDK